AAVGGQKINLRELVVAALRGEGDRLAVGRPARRVLALGAVRQLNGFAGPDACAPDVRDAPSGLTVGLRSGEEAIPTIWRELRIAQSRDVQEVDQAHRPLALGRASGRRERDHRRQNDANRNRATQHGFLRGRTDVAGHLATISGGWYNSHALRS